MSMTSTRRKETGSNRDEVGPISVGHVVETSQRGEGKLDRGGLAL